MTQIPSPYDTALPRRYSDQQVSTPPPTVYSLELPPIQNLPPDVLSPPSPESPNKIDEQTKKASSCSMPMHHPAPAFLEPVPQLDNHRMSHYESAFRPLLFKQKICKSIADKIPVLQIPVPRRTLQPIPTPSTTTPSTVATAAASVSAVTSSSHQQRQQVTGYSPMSPTMATASAAAAAAAVQHHPRSTVAESFLNCLRLSNLRNSTPPLCSLSSSSSTNSSSSIISDDEALLEEQDPATRVAAESLAAASAAANHHVTQGEQLVSLVMQNERSSGLDHTKFLTKNAHIKRPRNAWIHFRCHYGQALKTQDPTLRAEEISKRASRRWARLTENEKKPWHDLAEQEKLAHKEAFPEYRYCPKRHSPSSSVPSSVTPPTPVNPIHTQNTASAVGAEGLSEGDTNGHRYKKARRRTK